MTASTHRGPAGRFMTWLRDRKLYPDWREHPSPQAVQDTVIVEARKVVSARRAILGKLAAAGILPPGDVPSEKQVPPTALGLALSGGGIRSATISLGVAQAFASKGRFLDFDYCSTVSGGGYTGSFLTSLYLPEIARGPDGAAPKPGLSKAEQDLLDQDLLAKAQFARDALTSQARTNEMDHPATAGPQSFDKVRNPIWWLREHSRFLAPNGASDYAIAAAYMVRNWFAMIYVFALPLLLAALGLIAITASLLAPEHMGDLFRSLKLLGVVSMKKGVVCQVVGDPGCYHHAFSPIFFLAALTFFLSLGTGFAYWLTEFMGEASPISKKVQKSLFGRQRLKSRLRLVGSLLLMIVVVALVDMLSARRLDLLSPPFRTSRDLADLSPLALTILAGEMLAIVSILTAFFAGLRAWAGDRRDNAYTAEVRRLVTRVTSWMLVGTLVLLGIAIIDTAGLEIYARLFAGPKGQDPVTRLTALPVVLTPVIAWLINKLPSWFGGKESPVLRLLGRYIWTIALLAGATIVISLSLLAHVGAQYLIFEGRDWLGSAMLKEECYRLCLLGLFTLILTVLTGCATGFINLSSLHLIYASRLTRAYIGGTNIQRLAASADPAQNTSIRETHSRDQIDIDVYQQTRSAAPIHLINVTLNETRSHEKSQMLERDRKGVPVVFAPEGVFIDAGKKITHQQYYDWQSVEDHGVETLSVGQLCAISGAAASSAMGSRTTLGGALALTLANIRLGYWWNVDNMVRARQRLGLSDKDAILFVGKFILRWSTRALRTYFYLLNEARASYSRKYSRLNISDGGHFENSGAYELLRRHVHTILVCDNGADPTYVFEDLENLVRKARIDLGLYLRICWPDEVVELVGTKGAKLFLNGTAGDWRSRAKSRTVDTASDNVEDTGYCVLLRIQNLDKDNQSFDDGHIIWMKPSLFSGLPQDVVGYALEHPAFPNETTGDQFFDEAQWESYRSLGHSMAWRLLSESEYGADLLRRLCVTPRKRDS